MPRFKYSLKYISTINNYLIFKCLECKKSHRKHFNKVLIKKFANTYEFCNEDINKFCLMSRKGVYSYEYMDSWKRFDETSLPKKEDFYSNLNMEDMVIMICMLKVIHYFQMYLNYYRY